MRKTKKQKTLLGQVKIFQPGLALGVLGIAIAVGGMYIGADATNSTTLSSCKKVAVNDVAASTPAANQVAYKVVSTGQGGTAVAQVKAGSSCSGFMISLVSYKTPAANSLPYIQQTIHDSQTKALSTAVAELKVTVPPCYYQIDLAYGQPIDLTTGNNYNSTNLLWGAIGGTNKCTTPTPVYTPTPVRTPTPTPVHTPTPTPVRTPTPTPYHTPTPTPTPSMTPTPGTHTPTPTPTNTPTPTPKHTPTPTPVPSITPEVTPPPPPGETPIPPTTETFIQHFLPQTGKPGTLMTFIGALLITVGLVHIWLTQRRKLIGASKSKR